MAKPMGADVCIVGLGRTPMGGLNGSLSSIPATKLGSLAIQGVYTPLFVCLLN
jgi:acetyl-CoA acetyltransferase